MNVSDGEQRSSFKFPSSKQTRAHLVCIVLASLSVFFTEEQRALIMIYVARKKGRCNNTEALSGFTENKSERKKGFNFPSCMDGYCFNLLGKNVVLQQAVSDWALTS